MLKLTFEWKYPDNYMYLCTKFRNPLILWNPFRLESAQRKETWSSIVARNGALFYVYPVFIIFFF